MISGKSSAHVEGHLKLILLTRYDRICYLVAVLQMGAVFSTEFLDKSRRELAVAALLSPPHTHPRTPLIWEDMWNVRLHGDSLLKAGTQEGLSVADGSE